MGTHLFVPEMAAVTACEITPHSGRIQKRSSNARCRGAGRQCYENILRADSSTQPASTNLIIERQAIRLRRGKALKLVIPASPSGDFLQLRDDKLIALIAESRIIMGDTGLSG